MCEEAVSWEPQTKHLNYLPWKHLNTLHINTQDYYSIEQLDIYPIGPADNTQISLMDTLFTWYYYSICQTIQLFCMDGVSFL